MMTVSHLLISGPAGPEDQSEDIFLISAATIGISIPMYDLMYVCFIEAGRILALSLSLSK